MRPANISVKYVAKLDILQVQNLTCLRAKTLDKNGFAMKSREREYGGMLSRNDVINAI